MPGVGGAVAALLAYDNAKRTVKNPSRPFGEGVYEGVVAPEVANNVGIRGALIPLLTLRISGDFSSVTFMLVRAAITQSYVRLMGLNMDDVQGDKKIVSILQEMGADITITSNGTGGIKVKGNTKLTGTTIDCNEIPDSIPILSILGCCAEGETRLVNIESSRVKESDCPLLMTQELRKMGANISLDNDE